MPETVTATVLDGVLRTDGSPCRLDGPRGNTPAVRGMGLGIRPCPDGNVDTWYGSFVTSMSRISSLIPLPPAPEVRPWHGSRGTRSLSDEVRRAGSDPCAPDGALVDQRRRGSAVVTAWRRRLKALLAGALGLARG